MGRHLTLAVLAVLLTGVAFFALLGTDQTSSGQTPPAPSPAASAPATAAPSAGAASATSTGTAAAAAAATMTPTRTPGPARPEIPAAGTPATPAHERDFIIALAVIGLVALLPVLVDVIWAHVSFDKSRNELFKKIAQQSLTPANFPALEDVLKRFPAGAAGVFRITLASTIIMVVGLALFFIIVFDVPIGTNNQEIVKTTLTTLAGLIAAIVGFYYGTRAAQPTAASGGQAASQQGAPPPPVVIATVTMPAQKFTITGHGFKPTMWVRFGEEVVGGSSLTVNTDGTAVEGSIQRARPTVKTTVWAVVPGVAPASFEFDPT